MNHSRRFGSRFGFVVSMMGIAIGAGNIWRFPRIVAQNHSGAFLVAWMIFLFTWSIPLIITELSLGKLTRLAPIRAFSTLLGKKFSCIGAFITLVTTCIAAYYSVVVGWGFSYFIFSVLGVLRKGIDYSLVWSSYQHSWWPLVAHLLSVYTAFQIVRKGVVSGIERCNKILIPAFFICLTFFLVQVLSLPNAFQGLRELVSFNFHNLFHYKVWVEALSQNAWDTGAGWGLLFVYAGYARKKETIVADGITTAVLNNIVSLLMAVVVFSAAYSLSNQGISELVSGKGSSSLGLTFIYLPYLFSNMPGPQIFSIVFSAIFFLTFAMAALSSLISMLFLISNSLEELQIPSKKSNSLASMVIFILGIPSALSTAFFFNQDYVWGVALILNGLFIVMGAYKYGLKKLLDNVTNMAPGDIRVGNKFLFLVKYVIPFLGVSLITWYLAESFLSTPCWWNPLYSGGLLNILIQWGVPIFAFLLLTPSFLNKVNKN